MKILVTGCAGFIGSKVCELLLKDGHTITGVDSIGNANDVRLKEWRLSGLKDDPSFTFDRLDISVQHGLSSMFKRDRFEGVVNLAARAGVRGSLEEPLPYYETNLMGTLNLLELCREEGVRKFVQASTSAVYGDGKRPFREAGATDRPLSPYAASKKAAEELCYAYHHAYGLDVAVLRYFTVYGPAGRPDMAVFRFIRWIAEGEPVVLYGDGSQERDFTYVDDIARGTVLALKPLGYEAINLGSDRPVPVRQIICLMQEMVEKKASIEQRPAHPADVNATWADIGKARELLGWEPRVPIEEGLREAVAWYYRNRSWARSICA